MPTFAFAARTLGMTPLRRVGGSLRHAVLAALLAVALASIAAPAGANGFGGKVDPALAAVAAGASSSTPLHAIVYGSNLAAANTALGPGMTVRQPLGEIGGESVTIPAGNLSQLTAQAGVDYVALDRDIALTGNVTRPSLDGKSLLTQYPVADGAVSVWKQGYTGQNVGVAVIDSGVTSTSDFTNPNRVEQDKLQGQQDGSLNDPYGHGTFVAGVVGGYGLDGHFIGIAPQAKINAINISRPDGVRTSDVIAALLWVLQNYQGKHIGVVNLSLTETTPSSYLSSPLDAVVERLWRAGVVVVVSAGNKGPGTTSYAPANDPFVISVGATDTNGTVDPTDDTVASFSSSGVTQDGIYKPDLLAPGRRIGSVLPAGTVLDGEAPSSARLQAGYVQMSGTSFSAPQVSGAVALLLQERPNLTPDQIKLLLTETATPVTGSRVGELNIAAALAAPAPSAAAAAQSFTQARWGSTPPPVSFAPLPPPTTPAPPLVTVPQPKPPVPNGGPQPSAANPTATTCNPCVQAVAAETAASALPATTQPNNLAQAWEKAAQAWENVPSWQRAAADWLKATRIYESASTYDKASNDAAKSAVDYEKSAAWDKTAAWDDGAGAWEAAAADYQKTAAWDKAAAAWDSAEDDWAGVNGATAIATDAASGATDWQKFAAAQEAQIKAQQQLGQHPNGDAYDKAGQAWNASATDDSLAGQGQLASAAWDGAAVDWDTAAQLYRSQQNTNKALAEQSLAALDYDAAASAWDAAGAPSSATTAWAGAAADWQQVANAADQTANSSQGHAGQSHNANDYAKAAQAFDAAQADWQNQAAAGELAATDYDKTAAWDKGGAAFDQVAGQWNSYGNDAQQGAQDWTSAGNATAAATDAAAVTAAGVNRAADEQRSGDAWSSFGNLQNAANEYQRAGDDYAKTAAWDGAAKAYELSAAAWDKTAAWDHGAAEWEKAAAAWDTDGTWDSAGADWDNAANDWSNQLQLGNASNDLNNAGDEWARAGEWDKASFDWTLAATENPTVAWATPDVASNAWQGAAGAWFDSYAWN